MTTKQKIEIGVGSIWGVRDDNHQINQPRVQVIKVGWFLVHFLMGYLDKNTGKFYVAEKCPKNSASKKNFCNRYAPLRTE